ncbi:hypothetical protein B0H34DRAFT_646298 [Crassisporium funariophilum]|nr:hypothetical protein B0H34DRAFT_646298 [Crassisporium funariophilum]
MGIRRAAFETTAAEARLEAPNARIAHQVEVNAENERTAAQQAASVAKFRGESTTATDRLQEGVRGTTNAAAAEGKHDVDQAKAVGAGYVDQAKALAASAIETAQVSVGGKPADSSTTTRSTGFGTTTGSTQPGQGYLASAQNTASNAYTTVAETAKPAIEKAKEVVQSYVASGTAGTQGAQLTGGHGAAPPASSTGIPAATTAPLESGPHTINTPYPAVTGKMGTNVGANEGSPSIRN